jgi:hypothetical protein
MNEISTILNFIIDLFQQDNLVNTISMVPEIEVDANKENIYPLVNIDIQDSDPSDAVSVNFKIMIVQQRDTIPRKTDSKLLLDTNFIDNINETHAIANRFISVIENQNNTNNIEVDSRTRLTFIKNYGQQCLDGVKFTIALSIPNRAESC